MLSLRTSFLQSSLPWALTLGMLTSVAAGRPPQEEVPEPVGDPGQDQNVPPPLEPLEPELPNWVAPAEAEWDQLVQRDTRVAFTPRTALRALRTVEREDSTREARAAALVALGAAGEVLHRESIGAWAVEGDVLERRAALLALGELGAAGIDRIGQREEELLESALQDPVLEVAESALLALLRTRRQLATSLVNRIESDPDHRLAQVAPRLVQFQVEPGASEPTSAAHALLDLRWRAAREYGTVDGQAWSVVLLRTLIEDEAFLEAVILGAGAELRSAAAEDHLLELLLEDRTPPRLKAVVRRIAPELEQMIASGLWSPLSLEEWTVIVDAAVEYGVGGLLPRTLERALTEPTLAATAAAELRLVDSRFADTILASLLSPTPEVKRRACLAAARSGLERSLTALARLDKDPDESVRRHALLARASLGDTRAIGIVELRLRDEQDPQRAALLDLMVERHELPGVLHLLDQYRLSASGRDRALIVACLFLRGRATSLAELRAAFEDIEPSSPGGRLVLRALGQYPSGEDLEFLARQFPIEGEFEANVEMALALVRASHDAARPILQAAVWGRPWNRSVLAAGLVHRYSGARTLASWLSKPPPAATSEDIRRLGFSLGTWGGLRAFDSLRDSLGARPDDPALQGALLGALLARTAE